MLTEKFGLGNMDLTLVVRSPSGVLELSQDEDGINGLGIRQPAVSARPSIIGPMDKRESNELQWVALTVRPCLGRL